MLANESEDQEHLPKGGHEIILDIPMVQPRFPQNPHHRTDNILTAVAEGPQTRQASGEIQLKQSQTGLLKREAAACAPGQEGGSLPRGKERMQDVP